MDLDLNPRVYVACLASYNAGTLHGRWIDADQDADDIASEVAAMLRESPYPNVLIPCVDCYGTGKIVNHAADTITDCVTCKASGQVQSAEEWTVHDYDDFGDLAEMLGETSDVNAIAFHGQQLAEHGEAWIAYVSRVGSHYATAEDFTDSYRGEWDSEQAFAEELLEDMGELKDDSLASRYFDYEAFTRDVFLGDYSSSRSGHGTVYVFDRNV